MKEQYMQWMAMGEHKFKHTGGKRSQKLSSFACGYKM
jgi:hypothetical protein